MAEVTLVAKLPCPRCAGLQTFFQKCTGRWADRRGFWRDNVRYEGTPKCGYRGVGQPTDETRK